MSMVLSWLIWITLTNHSTFGDWFLLNLAKTIEDAICHTTCLIKVSYSEFRVTTLHAEPLRKSTHFLHQYTSPFTTLPSVLFYKEGLYIFTQHSTKHWPGSPFTGLPHHHLVRVGVNTSILILIVSILLYFLQASLIAYAIWQVSTCKLVSDNLNWLVWLVQGVQKFRNFAKLKLVETPQTPISLKSSIHEVSEYTWVVWQKASIGKGRALGFSKLSCQASVIKNWQRTTRYKIEAQNSWTSCTWKRYLLPRHNKKPPWRRTCFRWHVGKS
jgi:hypothetical protein